MFWLPSTVMGVGGEGKVATFPTSETPVAGMALTVRSLASRVDASIASEKVTLKVVGVVAITAPREGVLLMTARPPRLKCWIQVAQLGLARLEAYSLTAQ